MFVSSERTNLVEAILSLIMVGLGIVLAFYIQVWIIRLIVDAFTNGGGGGGHPTPVKQRLVRTMPARPQLARVYAAIVQAA